MSDEQVYQEVKALLMQENNASAKLQFFNCGILKILSYLILLFMSKFAKYFKLFC